MMIKQKILIIGPAWIGDMVMAQTLFKLLKQRLPKSIIHVLAPKWTSPVLERMPEVDKVLVSPFTHGELALYKRYKLGKSLRQENYDQAIVLLNSFKSALIPFWARILRRTGWRGEMRYGLLNDIRILNKNKLPLMIQRFAALGLDKSEVLPETLPWPELMAKKNKSVAEKVLALCPGAEFGPAKRWPAKYFAEVANNKLAEGWQIWLFGSKNDAKIAAEIQLIMHAWI
jgi:heptosyltransferase-2